MRTRNSIRLVVVAGVATMLACGGSDTTAPPEPVSVSLSPTTVAVNAGGTQNFTATVINATNTAVTWSATGGTINGSGATATFTAPLDGGPYTVTATSVEDNTKKASATVTVNAVAVALSPATATIPAGGTQQFTVTVNNTSNTTVTWTATGGTIDGTGSTVTYTAPATGGSYTVRATSVFDPTKSGTAAATVSSAAVSLTPTAQTVYRGEPVSLTATVTGAAVTTVTWSATCGAVTGTGATVTWTAPDQAGPCSVTAASSLDPAQTAAATMTVTSAWRVSANNDTDDGACTWTHCSLREALTAANANAGADTIRFVLPAARRVGATVAAAMSTMTLGSALPVISTDVHLIGPGADMLTIDANASQAEQRRVLEFNGDLTGSARGFTLRGGVATGGGGVSVSNGAMVTLADLIITENEALGAGGGGILADGSGSLTLDNVTVQQNTTSNEGGGVRVLGAAGLTGSISNSTITENTAQTAAGISLGNLGTFSISGTTISKNTSNTRVGGVFLWGTSDVAITNSTITQNVAQGTGGGGGLYTQNTAKATVTNTTINNNRALGINQLGGGVTVGTGSTVEMTGGSISGNEVGAGSGGAISAFNCTVKLTNVTVADNKATTVGGGGAIYANGATLTIMGGTFHNNVTQVGAGGAILQDGGTASIDGTTFTANKNMGSFAGGAVSMLNAANLTITGATFDGNQATAAAGAIALNNTGTLTVSNSVFMNNSGNFGGALQKAGASTFTATNTRFTGNTAVMQSGALHLLNGGSATLQRVTVMNNTSQTGGGGLTSGGILTVENSTIANNTTGATATGGGMFLSSTGTSTITNTTISGNSAQIGGGIGVTGNATLKNLTIVGNTATNFGGGIGANVNGVITYSNSLLSGNQVGGAAGNCGFGGAGQVNSAGFNLSSDGTCGAIAGIGGATVVSQGIVPQPSDRHNTAAGVGALADNGGATMTHALLAGSAAINGANPATCSTTDQRGAPRVDACDNGAFEFGGTVPTGGRGGPASSANRRRSGGGG